MSRVPRFRMAIVPILWLMTAQTLPLAGQTQIGTKQTLAIGPVTTLASVSTAATTAGKRISLDRVVEALDGQLIDRFSATRKFQIVVQSDLKPLIDNQEYQRSGNVEPATAAEINRLTGAKYLVVTTLDDFDDQTQRRQNSAARSVTTKRTIRLGAVCKIYGTTTGKLLESASNLIQTNSISETLQEASNNAEATDELLRRVTRDMADWAAVRVADVIYPAKILARTGKQVTINRGDGAGLCIGQIWNVNSLGKELKDPDTGEVLGNEEVPAGKVRITEVDPKFSKAEIVEDLGMDAGAILRLCPTEPKAP